jgi:PAS domain S-box-containing protein
LETTSLHDIGHLRTILNAVQTGILMINAENHRIVYANPAAFQIVGYPKEQVIGAVCHSFICPAEVGKCPITDLGQCVDNSERVVLDAHGERVPVLKTVVPTITEGRKYLIESFLDIRERKKSEQRLLSERLAAIAELAGMVGHDLRNPLQGIAGAAYLLRRNSSSPEARNEMLQVIDDCVRYANDIVADLLDYSAEVRLKLEEAAPKSIIQAAIKSVKVPENVTVRDLSENHPALRVDLDRMRRVCINILTNAIDAMPEGGGITIASKRLGDRIEIAFTDTGCGMSEKAMENLWKPLQTTKAKGMGFGLAICKRIVEAHRGTIRAESSIGKGSTFTVTLPIRNVTNRDAASEQ